MYQVELIIEFEDGQKFESMYNFWSDACAAVEYFANESEHLPKIVKMKMIK
ncbi:MAG: hypothetical protein ACFFCM_16505 [Promethearchaeota archaeon]